MNSHMCFPFLSVTQNTKPLVKIGIIIKMPLMKQIRVFVMLAEEYRHYYCPSWGLEQKGAATITHEEVKETPCR